MNTYKDESEVALAAINLIQKSLPDYSVVLVISGGIVGNQKIRPTVSTSGADHYRLAEAISALADALAADVDDAALGDDDGDEQKETT